MPTDLMLDLETLGTRVESGVPVLQLGWCLWSVDPAATEASSSGSWFVRDAPGQIDPSNAAWWQSGGRAEQFAQLQARCDSDGLLLYDVLLRLDDLVRQEKPRRVWSHGSMFDIAILEYWYRHLGLRVPWKYSQVMDTRTLFALTGAKIAGNDHDAERDALNEARLAGYCWNEVAKAIDHYKRWLAAQAERPDDDAF